MIDQKKPEPDGYLAWHPEHGWEEYKHLRQKPDNPGLLNKLGDGWQIKPVWISEQPPPPSDIAKNIWLLMFGAFKGGALCDKEQLRLYESAKRIAHDNLDLGSPIRLKLDLTPPPDLEKENEK